MSYNAAKHHRDARRVLREVRVLAKTFAVSEDDVLSAARSALITQIAESIKAPRTN